MVAEIVAGAAQGGASSLGWPWWIAVPLAIAIATLFATFVGWLGAHRGHLPIMITLAIGVSFFTLNQNYSIFGGHEVSMVHPLTCSASVPPADLYHPALFCALAAISS
jgi:branched-chain amino acid transport system permease protein